MNADRPPPNQQDVEQNYELENLYKHITDFPTLAKHISQSNNVLHGDLRAVQKKIEKVRTPFGMAWFYIPFFLGLDFCIGALICMIYEWNNGP